MAPLTAPARPAVRPAVGWVLAAFYLFVLPLVLTNYNVGHTYNDQRDFHLPTIRWFAERGLDFGDYRPASTPGYHLALASVARGLSGAEPVLKLASSLFTAAFLAILAALLAARFRATTVLALLAPAVVSIYVLPSGIWLGPENLGWLTVLVTLLACLTLDGHPSRVAWAVVGLAAAVLVRQSNAWLAVPIVVAMLLPAADGPPRPVWRRLPRAALAVVPGVLTLAAFFLLWGGLVPPNWAQRHQSPNFAVPAFVLTVFGVYALFYLPLATSALHAVWADPVKRRRILLGAAIGAVLALLPATNYGQSVGRVSGLWVLAKLPPVVADRSFWILAAATWGGASLAAWLQLARPRTQLVLLAAFVAFVAAQTANHFAYERYYGAMVLMLILLLLREARVSEPARRRVLLAPLAFAALNAVAFVYTIVRPG